MKRIWTPSSLRNTGTFNPRTVDQYWLCGRFTFMEECLRRAAPN